VPPYLRQRCLCSFDYILSMHNVSILRAFGNFWSLGFLELHLAVKRKVARWNSLHHTSALPCTYGQKEQCTIKEKKQRAYSLSRLGKITVLMDTECTCTRSPQITHTNPHAQWHALTHTYTHIPTQHSEHSMTYLRGSLRKRRLCPPSLPRMYNALEAIGLPGRSRAHSADMNSWTTSAITTCECAGCASLVSEANTYA